MADNDIPSCKLMEVKKEVPAWMQHRNRVLKSINTTGAVPSDESETTDDGAKQPQSKPKWQKPKEPSLQEADFDAEAAYRGSGNSPNPARAFINAAAADIEAAAVYNKTPTRNSNVSGGTSPVSPESSNSTSSSDGQVSPKSLDSFSDDSIVMMSSDGSSGWSTPNAADASSASLSASSMHEEKTEEKAEAPPEPEPNHPSESSLEMISESNRQVFMDSTGESPRHVFMDSTEESQRTEVQSLKSESNNNNQLGAGEQQSSVEYIEESYRTGDSGETFETVTEEEVNEKSSSKEQPQKHQQQHQMDTTNERSLDTTNERSTHSAASFWGNPVRFADPFREKSETNDDMEDDIYREPVGDKTAWTYRRSKRPTYRLEKEEAYAESDLPDPPAAMDGSSLHKNIKYRKRINESMSVGAEQNPWMPPSNHQREGKNHEEVLSTVTDTIADTMEQLAKADSPMHQFTDSLSAEHSLPCDPSVEGGTRQEGASKRIDFAGQTTTRGFSGASQGSGSPSYKIRKYYDHGRHANEEMRRLYMPTAVPAIARLDSAEDELFDWVPQKYKPNAIHHNDNQSRGNQSGYMGGVSAVGSSVGDSVADNYTSADENYTSAGENYTSAGENYTSAGENYTSADENYRSGDGNYTSDYRSGDGNYTSDYRSGDGNYTSDYRSGDGNYTSDYRSADGNYTSDHRTADGNYTSDYRSADGNYTSDHRTADGNYTSDHRTADGNYTSDYRSGDGNYTSADDRNYVSNFEDEITRDGYGRDIESNRDENPAFEERAIPDGMNPDGTIVSKDGQIMAPTVDTVASETNHTKQVKVKRFPCSCVHIGICLIIFLVPGIVFGIRYYPEWSGWIKNLFS